MHERGQQQALQELGIVKTAGSGLSIRALKDPYVDLHRKLLTAFKMKTPKFDFSALIKRMLNNPFKQPQAHIAGKWPGLRQ